MSMIRLLSVVFILFLPLFVNGGVVPMGDLNENNLVTAITKSSGLLTTHIEEKHTFHGLASYYNDSNYYIVSSDDLYKVRLDDVIKLQKNQWLAIVGRYNVLLIYVVGITGHLNESGLIIDNPETLNQLDTIVRVVAKPYLSSVATELDQIRYAHLWWPLAQLAKIVEYSLISIQYNIVSSWGLTIVIFSILLKFILLPVSLMTIRFQRRMAQVQAQLAPKLLEIKKKYDGEEAHNRIMAAHNELGVSPFYTLKPILGLFVQIPLMISVFNALGEMPQLDGQTFLWIENLAYPDSVGNLSFSIPIFGNVISLLPFIMTAVTLYSTIIFQNRYATKVELKYQKRNLYLMGAAFFVLFYPFPASMVLYWASSNILHVFLQKKFRV